MLDPRRLRVLIEVDRRGSIAAAAESMSFVPSAISQQIDALERELGIELTTRAGRGTVLTNAGRILVARGEEVLRQLDEMEESLRNLSGPDSGRLRIAAVRSLAATLVPDALAALARAHPGLDVSLVERDRSGSYEALRRHEVDLAVVDSYDMLSQLRELRVTQRELFSESSVVAVATQHPLAGQQGVRLDLLAADRWIVGRTGTDGHLLVLHACRQAGFEPRIAHVADDWLVKLRLVSAGQGIAFVPPQLLQTVGHATAAIRIEGAPHRKVLAAWRNGVTSEAIEAMVPLLAAAGPASR